MKRIILWVLMLIVMVFLFLSVIIANTKPVKVVGFSQMEYNNPFRIAETNSINAEALKRGYELIITDAKGQVSKQIADVKALINQNVNYIILAPREYEGLAPALQFAKQKKVPVILIDRDAAGKPGVDYVTLIASDFILEGERAAAWLAKTTNRKANIIELTGTIGSSAARDRSLGFRRTIAKYPQMKIITSECGDFSRTTGLSVMEGLIETYGAKINAVFAQNDEMAIGAIQAFKAAGIVPGKDVILVSIDGERDALKAIMAGELGATVECSPRFGPKVFDVIEKCIRGETIPIKIVNTDRFFDSSNAKYFIEEAY